MNVNADCIFGLGVDKTLSGFLEACGVVAISVESYRDSHIDALGVIAQDSE